MRKLIERLEAFIETYDDKLLGRLKKAIKGLYIVGWQESSHGKSRSLRKSSGREADTGEEIPFEGEVIIAQYFVPTGKAGDMLVNDDWYGKIKKLLPKHKVSGKLHGQSYKVYFE